MLATLLLLTAPIAIKAGRMIDSATDTVATKQIILVEGDKIAAIGPNLAVPDGARIVDLSGQTVLPGLIDAHTHLCATVDSKWDLGDFWIMTLQRRAGFRAIQGAQHAREMLEAGFTTVRDVGNAGDYLDMDLEKAVRFGIVPGPTILPAGRIIGPFSGQFWDTPADRRLLDSAEFAFVDSRDEMRKAIRENVYWGRESSRSSSTRRSTVTAPMTSASSSMRRRARVSKSPRMSRRSAARTPPSRGVSRRSSTDGS